MESRLPMDRSAVELVQEDLRHRFKQIDSARAAFVDTFDDWWKKRGSKPEEKEIVQSRIKDGDIVFGAQQRLLKTAFNTWEKVRYYEYPFNKAAAERPGILEEMRGLDRRIAGILKELDNPLLIPAAAASSQQSRNDISMDIPELDPDAAVAAVERHNTLITPQPDPKSPPVPSTAPIREPAKRAPSAPTAAPSTPAPRPIAGMLGSWEQQRARGEGMRKGQYLNRAALFNFEERWEKGKTKGPRQVERIQESIEDIRMMNKDGKDSGIWVPGSPMDTEAFLYAASLQTPIDVDRANPSFMFKGAQLRGLLRSYVDNNYFNAIDSSEKAACQFLRSKLLEGDVVTEAEQDFWVDFIAWLMGVPRVGSDIKNTPWLMNKHLPENKRNLGFWNPEIGHFLTFFVKAKHKFQHQINELKIRGPTSLVEAYLYFKYVVRLHDVEGNYLNDIMHLNPVVATADSNSVASSSTSSSSTSAAVSPSSGSGSGSSSSVSMPSSQSTSESSSSAQPSVPETPAPTVPQSRMVDEEEEQDIDLSIMFDRFEEAPDSATEEYLSAESGTLRNTPQSEKEVLVPSVAVPSEVSPESSPGISPIIPTPSAAPTETVLAAAAAAAPLVSVKPEMIKAEPVPPTEQMVAGVSNDIKAEQVQAKIEKKDPFFEAAHPSVMNAAPKPKIETSPQPTLIPKPEMQTEMPTLIPKPELPAKPLNLNVPGSVAPVSSVKPTPPAERPLDLRRMIIKNMPKSTQSPETKKINKRLNEISELNNQGPAPQYDDRKIAALKFIEEAQLTNPALTKPGVQLALAVIHEQVPDTSVGSSVVEEPVTSTSAPEASKFRGRTVPQNEETDILKTTIKIQLKEIGRLRISCRTIEDMKRIAELQSELEQNQKRYAEITAKLPSKKK